MKKEGFLEYYETDKTIPMIFTNIDFEEVILKKINEDYEIEISCYKNKNINLYLWKKYSIIGTILYGERDLYKYYEEMFKKICIEIGQEIRIDFKHKTINIFENKEEKQ